MDKKLTSLSKFLALVLRHKPEEIGITLNDQGWCNIDELIEKSNNKGTLITREDITTIVNENSKKRYTISDDGQMIRAAQGHSTANVEINHVSKRPPRWLYHGTAVENIKNIKNDGLKKMSRHHVHLSEDISTAVNVAKRHSKDIVIYMVNAGYMEVDGYEFFISDNGVWLTDNVPSNYMTMHIWQK